MSNLIGQSLGRYHIIEQLSLFSFDLPPFVLKPFPFPITPPNQGKMMPYR
jgi:hypothetical protein